MIKKKFGTIGEKIAIKYLKQNNYKILDNNFLYKGGELDIIAFDQSKGEIVFIEVKTRSTKRFGLPSEAVDDYKIKHMERGIEYYLYYNKIKNAFVRVDIIELYYYSEKKKFFINHIKQVI